VQDAILRKSKLGNRAEQALKRLPDISWPQVDEILDNL